jgi:hypothetical protein
MCDRQVSTGVSFGVENCVLMVNRNRDRTGIEQKALIPCYEDCSWHGDHSDLYRLA